MSRFFLFSIGVLVVLPLISFYFQFLIVENDRENTLSSIKMFGIYPQQAAPDEADEIHRGKITTRRISKYIAASTTLPSRQAESIENDARYSTKKHLPKNLEPSISNDNLRCRRGLDYTGRDLFRSQNDLVFPRPYDAFAKGSLLYMVFLSRENRKDIDLNEDNSDWKCTFDEGRTVPGTKLNEQICQQRHVQIITCPIPRHTLDAWGAADPKYQQAQSVMVTAFSLSANVPFRYDRIDFCRYPPAEDWKPRGNLTKATLGASADGTYAVQLAACTMLRHELGRNRDLTLEWLAYHRLQGVEHFYIFSNGDTRALRRTLRPFVDEGVVEVLDWEWNLTSWVHQLPQTNACIYRYLGLARWVALMDVDEFFQAAPALGGSLLSVLARRINDPVGALCAPMVMFRGAPDLSETVQTYGDLVTADFVHRAAVALPSRGKCICRPERVNIMDVHEYCGGMTAAQTDADKELRLNHYKAGGAISAYGWLYGSDGERFDVEDHSMMAAAAAVREELRRLYTDGIPTVRRL